MGRDILGTLTDAERERYGRQMLIAGWGEEAQRRLKAATVFVAGAGGLGSAVSVALAVAGVGTLRICDCDATELSNLNRQFLHDDTRLGMNKAESARRTLSRLNPQVRVEALPARIEESNVGDLIGDTAVVVDCLDNFPTRFVLNAAAVRRRIPFVHGSIWGLEGRVTFLHAPRPRASPASSRGRLRPRSSRSSAPRPPSPAPCRPWRPSSTWRPSEAC